MNRTLKILLVFPDQRNYTWTRPRALMKRDASGNYGFPLVIENTQSYPFDCRDEGSIEPNPALIGELVVSAGNSFGERIGTMIVKRHKELRLIHKNESTAYFFFSEFFEWDLDEGLVLLDHSALLAMIAAMSVHKRGPRKYRKQGLCHKSSLDHDDLEALRKTLRYFVRRESRQSDKGWGRQIPPKSFSRK